MFKVGDRVLYKYETGLTCPGEGVIDKYEEAHITLKYHVFWEDSELTGWYKERELHLAIPPIPFEGEFDFCV